MRTVVLGMCVAVAGLASAVEVKSTSLAVTLDERAKGAVSRIASRGGYDFSASVKGGSLFTLWLVREDNRLETASVHSHEAKSFAVESVADGARLVYGGFAKAVDKVVCTVASGPDDDKVRWRIAVTPKAGWKLTETYYPSFAVAAELGSSGADDVIVGGTAKGGLIRNPAALPKNKNVFWGRQPGNLVCQFLAFYDDARLLYFAAEDGRGGTKDLCVTRTDEGLKFSWRRFGWDSDGRDFGYDFVLAAREGTAAQPCVWQDAADLYRRWAVKQRWCTAPLRERADLPAWMKDAPAMVRFYRQHFEDPDSVRRWMDGYWKKEYPEMPLVVAMWGWEHRATWCSDYFPCCPSDEAFTALVRDIRQAGGHAFPWPSGYHWTLMQGQQPDGSFAYDDRARFNRIAAPHAVWNRDGKIYDRLPGWLAGGHVACMCPGDPWSMNWWNRDVSLELAKRGCELVQADQVVGGAFPECWATNHPHAPGQGPWKAEVFREQLRTMRETMRTVEKDAVVCFEEPDELFNDLIGIQDYRDCEVLTEWASVFNYVYHEYVPCFQSDLFNRGNRQWLAHCAVDGQIPFFGWPTEEEAAGGGPAMSNGDFERLSADGKSFPGWENPACHHVERETVHGGGVALRMETANITNHQQIARNITLDTGDFRPGRTYRLSMWMKSEKKGRYADACYGLYTPGFKASRANGNMQFPKPEEGWVRRESTFVMPDEANLTLRFMINVGQGENRVWVDDVKLEEIGAGGAAKDAVLSGRGAYHRFMSAWVRLYHGEGRDWLAHGRQVRPPRVWCGTTEYEDHAISGSAKAMVGRPNVHSAAYESLDGRRALVFANATAKPQAVTYEAAAGELRTLKLDPDDLKLVRWGE